MRILAIDTATEACSVALWNDGTVNAHFELCPREHTQRILPMVQDILTTSGTSLTDINALAYGRGPGSFTGVRIGIGIAQGLALGAELPMIGVSTLMTMAQGAWRKNGATRVLAAIDARMGEVYWAEYQRDENGNIVIGDEMLTPDSSRFWPADEYEPGHGQPSFDKQFARDWLKSNEHDWKLPQDIVDKTIDKYFQAYEMLTGKDL